MGKGVQSSEITVGGWHESGSLCVPVALLLTLDRNKEVAGNAVVSARYISELIRLHATGSVQGACCYMFIFVILRMDYGRSEDAPYR